MITCQSGSGQLSKSCTWVGILKWCYQTLSIQSADYVIFDNMPVVSDNRPVESDNMPVESDNIPVESDNMLVDSDNMPVHCSS